MAQGIGAPTNPLATFASTLIALMRTSRPLGWIAALALFRIGMASCSAEDTFATIGLSLAITFPFCLYLFGLNDIADKDSDASNPRKGSWLHGASAPIHNPTASRWAPWIGGATVASFIPLIPCSAGSVLSGILLVSWGYSCKPFRLKEVPIIDGLATAFIMIGILCVGFLTSATPVAIPIETFAVAPTLAGLHIFASVVDVESDRKANHRTLAVRAGPRTASVVALALSIVSAASIPFLAHADAIALYLVIQPCVIATWTLFHRWFSPRYALYVLGTSGLVTLAYMALTSARDW